MCSKFYNYLPLDKICEVIPPDNVENVEYELNVNNILYHNNCTQDDNQSTNEHDDESIMKDDDISLFDICDKEHDEEESFELDILTKSKCEV